MYIKKYVHADEECQILDATKFLLIVSFMCDKLKNKKKVTDFSFKCVNNYVNIMLVPFSAKRMKSFS